MNIHDFTENKFVLKDFSKIVSDDDAKDLVWVRFEIEIRSLGLRYFSHIYVYGMEECGYERRLRFRGGVEEFSMYSDLDMSCVKEYTKDLVESFYNRFLAGEIECVHKTYTNEEIKRLMSESHKLQDKLHRICHMANGTTNLDKIDTSDLREMIDGFINIENKY